MTTYTLTGTVIYTDYFTGGFRQVKDTGGTVEIVVRDSISTVNYSVLPPDFDNPVGEAAITLDSYNIRFNGELLSDGFNPDGTTLATVGWTQFGQPRSTTALDFIFYDFPGTGLGRVDAEFLFELGGSPFPIFDSEAALDSMTANVTGLAQATGRFAPGIDIPLGDLGSVAVTENDVITGTMASDTFFGGRGADRISGGSGDDRLSGGAGNDILNGGLGGDLLRGGGGQDRVVYNTASSQVTVNLTRPELNQGEALGDRYFGIEQIGGSGFGDTLRGNLLNNWIAGGNGADFLYGMNGNDRLLGNNGNDTLVGGRGRDTLLGGNGRDTLSGGGGNDVLTGGGRRDVFVFNLGRDTITDFGNDRLRLDDALWDDAAMTKSEIMAFATVTNGDTVFDFGDGHTLTLLDYTDLTALESAITVF